MAPSDKYAEDTDTHVVAIQRTRGPCMPRDNDFYIVDYSGSGLLSSFVQAIPVAAAAFGHGQCDLFRRHVQTEGGVSGMA